MRRASAFWVVGVVCASVLVGCRSQAPRTVQVEFREPEGGKVSVFAADKGVWGAAMTMPALCNLADENLYRLRLTDLPNQAGVTIYGRLKVERQTDFTIDSAVPLPITRDDIEQAKSNVQVVKVIYLPDEKHAVYQIAGATTSIVSTRLEPGKDAVEEAKKQGTVLLVLRLGGRQYGQ
jgi:hypothetical protein